MKVRILVIEDNAQNLELIEYVLRASGHEVLTAETGMHGIEIARREQLDLVLCDLRMPTLDGYEVARLMKTDTALRSIPLVAVSASVSGADRSTALAAGFSGFLPKPIDPETFSNEVLAYIVRRDGATGENDG